MLRSFFEDEKGQAGLEYILTVGSIIVAVVVIFNIYRKMGEAGFNQVEGSANASTSMMSSRISSEVANL